MFNYFKKSCSICKRKIKPLTAYKTDTGKILKVCNACREYAERRAYKQL